MIEVILYSREDCHLCEVAMSDLAELKEQFPHLLNIINIDQDPELTRKYGSVIPVVECGSQRLIAPFDREKLSNLLSSTYQDLQKRKVQPESEKSKIPDNEKTWSGADRFTKWFSSYYIFVINLLVLIYVGLPFIAPVLLKAGYETPAIFLYRAYGLVCHQLSFRSFFLFGEQSVYPREAAHVDDLISFSIATGLGEGNSAKELFAARRYVGEEEVGFKVALCQRDVAIYAAILLFGVLFGITGRRLPALPWYLWLLIGIIPIGLDGISQIISQPPLNLIPYRESTPLTRIATGALFGFTTAWFGYPLIEETMRDTRRMVEHKYNHLTGQTK